MTLPVAPVEPEPRLELGDLGAAHGHAMRRRPVELDHRAVTFLADEGDMGDRDDMAAAHPDEQAGTAPRFRLPDRPWAQPLAGAALNPRTDRVGPHAPKLT